MEVKQAKETSLKGTEPLITVPNPRNHQQQNSIASAARLSTNNQNKPTKDTTTNSISSGGPTDSKTSNVFQSLYKFDTVLSADSLEFCPIDGYQDVVLCGTYQLTDEESRESGETEEKRRGVIYLFKVLEKGHLELLQQVEVPAVLDSKWCHVKFNDKILLGVVNALGYLQIYELEQQDDRLRLKLLVQRKIDSNENNENLALSLDWSTGRGDSSRAYVTVSNSNGTVVLLELNQGLISKFAWKAHEFEAWITAFNYWDVNVVFSGGDDCKFLSFDARVGDRPVMTSRVHEAGVTSFHSNSRKEHLFVSGSYDEKLRLWDLRSTKKPVSETNLNGGIWRLKWDPFKQNHLLAACMYGGFRLVKYDDSQGISVVGEFHEHESIAYGCDWSYLSPSELSKKNIYQDNNNAHLVGTCSFYDHLLKISVVEKLH